MTKESAPRYRELRAKVREIFDVLRLQQPKVDAFTLWTEALDPHDVRHANKDLPFGQ